VPRRLLLGRAGAGKTHACLDKLEAALREGRRPLLLVPTYSQAEHLRYALLDRSGGLSEHTVETFSSLAERVTGLRLRNLLPHPVRDRVARAVLEEIFPEAAAQAGFRAEFLRVVKEIKDQGRVPADALGAARAHFDASSREASLFEAFARYVETQPGPDHEDLLLAARDGLRADPLELDLLLVDGFHDFTPVEREVVDAVADRAAETVVTLPLDPDDMAEPVFATSARTAAGFAGYERVPLRENRRAQSAQVAQTAGTDRGGPSDLARLERRLFRPPEEPALREGIEVLACPSEDDEADRLARIVAASGRPFHDFLVVRRSFEGVEATYRAAFRRHGVPLRFFGSEPLGQIPAARAATLLLRSLTGDVELRDLLPLLRSPYLLDAPPPGEVDRLAGDLRKLKVVRSFDDYPRSRHALRPPESTKLSAVLRERLGVRDALVARPDGSGEIARASRFVTLLLREAEAVDGLSLAEAAAAVLRRVPLLRAPSPDRRHDCVYAVEARDARQWEKPVVMVAGLGSEAFPRQVRQDLFLRDEERRALGAERGLHLPLRSRKEDEERYLFYVALTRARERLYLSYAAFDEEGTPRCPSPYLEETLAHVDPAVRRDVPLSTLFAGPRDVVRFGDLLPLVADGLLHGDAVAAALYESGAVDRAEIAWPHRLSLARTRPVRELPDDYAAKLSASSLDSYRRCPYLFLTRKALGLQKPREPALDPLLRGDIVHEALERIARERRDADEVFQEVFEQKTEGLRLGLGDDAQHRWMRAAVRKAAEDLRPVDVETQFERDLGDGITLVGRIDRIDGTPAGPLIRDYKTGRSITLKSIRNFEKLQLDVYLLAFDHPAGAVFDQLRKGKAVGLVVDEFADPPEGHVERVTRAELETRRETVRGIVRDVAARVRAGRLAVHPSDPETCTRQSCDGYDLCRVARARWLAKAGRAKR